MRQLRLVFALISSFVLDQTVLAGVVLSDNPASLELNESFLLAWITYPNLCELPSQSNLIAVEAIRADGEELSFRGKNEIVTALLISHDGDDFLEAFYEEVEPRSLGQPVAPRRYPSDPRGATFDLSSVGHTYVSIFKVETRKTESLAEFAVRLSTIEGSLVRLDLAFRKTCLF